MKQRDKACTCVHVPLQNVGEVQDAVNAGFGAFPPAFCREACIDLDGRQVDLGEPCIDMSFMILLHVVMCLYASLFHRLQK